MWRSAGATAILTCATQSSLCNASNCPEFLFHMWYLDDVTITGPKLTVLRALSVVQDLGPPYGLFVSTSKCELYSTGNLSIFPFEMKSCTELNFEILGTPIGVRDSFSLDRESVE